MPHTVTIPTVMTWNDEPATVEVPDGHLHTSELVTRGWTSSRIGEIAPHAVHGVSTSAQVTPKCYPVKVVEAVEAEHAEEFAAQAKVAKAAQRKLAELKGSIPRREEGYEPSECVGRAYLKACGWTETHLKRLLGTTPDATTLGTYGRVHLWARERIAEAERTDAKLQKRLEQHKEKKRAKKQSAVAETIEAGHAVFAKTPTGWALRGRDLTPGQEVTVKRKNGTTETMHVGSILSTEDDGTVLAAIGKAPRPAPAPRRDPAPVATPAPAPARKQAPADATRTLKGRERDWFGDDTHFSGFEVGEVVRDRDGIWMVLAVDREAGYDIETEQRNVWWTAHVREATEEEAAPVVTYEAAVRERHEMLAAREAAAKEFEKMAFASTLLEEAPDRTGATHCRLQRSELTGYDYSPPSWEAYLMPDGRVYATWYYPGFDDLRYYKVTAPGAAELARAAAWRIYEPSDEAPGFGCTPDVNRERPDLPEQTFLDLREFRFH